MTHETVYVLAGPDDYPLSEFLAAVQNAVAKIPEDQRATAWVSCNTLSINYREQK